MAPTEGVFRTTSRDTEIAGCPMKARAKVRAVVTSANRDEQVFTNPDDVNIERDRSGLQQHLSFGRGAHACLGNTLARQELMASLGTIVQRLPFELDAQRAPRRRMTMAANGFEYLSRFRTPVTRRRRWQLRSEELSNRRTPCRGSGVTSTR